MEVLPAKSAKSQESGKKVAGKSRLSRKKVAGKSQLSSKKVAGKTQLTANLQESSKSQESHS